MENQPENKKKQHVKYREYPPVIKGKILKTAGASIVTALGSFCAARIFDEPSFLEMGITVAILILGLAIKPYITGKKGTMITLLATVIQVEKSGYRYQNTKYTIQGEDERVYELVISGKKKFKEKDKLRICMDSMQIFEKADGEAPMRINSYIKITIAG